MAVRSAVGFLTIGFNAEATIANQALNGLEATIANFEFAGVVKVTRHVGEISFDMSQIPKSKTEAFLSLIENVTEAILDVSETNETKK